jgi:hypothetical protein
MRSSMMVLALVLALPTLAFAQGATGTPEEQAACRPDVRRLCHTSKGQDAVTECLKAHRDKLSKPCKAVFEAHGQ